MVAQHWYDEEGEKAVGGGREEASEHHEVDQACEQPGAGHGEIAEDVRVQEENQLADHARQRVAKQLPHEDRRDDDAEGERLRQDVEAIGAPNNDRRRVLAKCIDATLVGRERLRPTAKQRRREVDGAENGVGPVSKGEGA